jgi:hypothetical protein
MRPAVQITHCDLGHVEPQVAIQCGKDLLKMNRPGHRLLGEPVCRPDDLARRHASPGEQGKRIPAPVIAAGVLVDLWSPAKFPPRHHCHIVLQTEPMEIIDKRRETLVKQWPHLPTIGEVATMPVEIREGD